MNDRLGVLALRARRHNLSTRLSANALTRAADVAGIRDAQGSAIVALHARVSGVEAGSVDSYVRRGDLLDVLSARGTRTLVPSASVAAFTLGTVPADEESLRFRLKPFLRDLDRSGHSATDALARAKDVARAALAGGPSDIGALSGALTRGLPELSPMCRGRCGVAHIDGLLFDLVGESGVWRHDQVDGVRLFVAMDEPTDAEASRAELVRRYLAAYGPSTPAQFGDWCGISRKDATRAISGCDTTEVGRGAFVLRGDEEHLAPPVAMTGVRLLPPRDPYLLARDRETLIPEREVQKRVWRSTPTDGIVLVDGEPAATWRTKKLRAALRFDAQPFRRLSKTALSQLEDEARAVAVLRGCETAEVNV